MVRLVGQFAWMQRIVLGVIGLNIALILAGFVVVPAHMNVLSGVGPALGDVCIQLAIGGLALAGPWSLQRCQPVNRINLAFGLLFAAAYLAVILIEFQGIQTNVNIISLFIVVGFVAGGVASVRTRRWDQGLIAAPWSLVIGTLVWSAGFLLINYVAWGSHQQYVFWLADGAIDEFHRSRSPDLNAFLLQDIQGALFFHPLLSLVVGVISGLISSTLAQAVVILRRSIQ